MVGKLRKGLGLAGLLLASGTWVAAQQQIKVKPVDFDLPLGIEENLPAGVPLSDVFVSEDFCFYYRLDGQFFLLDCVG